MFSKAEIASFGRWSGCRSKQVLVKRLNFLALNNILEAGE